MNLSVRRPKVNLGLIHPSIFYMYYSLASDRPALVSVLKLNEHKISLTDADVALSTVLCDLGRSDSVDVRPQVMDTYRSCTICCFGHRVAVSLSDN